MIGMRLTVTHYLRWLLLEAVHGVGERRVAGYRLLIVAHRDVLDEGGEGVEDVRAALPEVDFSLMPLLLRHVLLAGNVVGVLGRPFAHMLLKVVH